MQLLSFFFHEQVLRFILRLLEHIVKSRDFGNDFLGLLPVSLTFDKRVSVDFSYSVLSNNQLYSHLRSKQKLIYNYASTHAKKHSISKLRGMLKKANGCEPDLEDVLKNCSIQLFTFSNLSRFLKLLRIIRDPLSNLSRTQKYKKSQKANARCHKQLKQNS